MTPTDRGRTDGDRSPVAAVAVIGADEPFTRRLVADLDGAGLAARLVAGSAEGLAGSSADVAVYAALARSRRSFLPDPDDAAACFATLARSAVGHVVVLSSATAVEPDYRHPGFVPERYADKQHRRALRSQGAHRAHRGAVARAWSALEASAERVLGRDACTLLRPVGLIDPPRLDLLSRLAGGGLVPTALGHDPSIQLLASADLAGAVRAAIERRRPGAFHVVPRGVVPVHEAIRLAGGRRLPLPFWLLRGLRWLSRRLGRGGALEAIDYLRFPWSVSGARGERELGFRAASTSAEAVLARAPRSPHRDPAAAPHYDDFGLDERFIERLGSTLLRFLHDVWWRIETRGLEHVPRRGRAVLAGIHRGFMPWDGVMALYLIDREIGRKPRFLIHPGLVKFPFLALFHARLGGVPANFENASRLLERDELLAIFPEGIHGAFRLYRDAYRVSSFGRHDFVRMALAHRAPIVPFVTVGSAEIFPILGRIRSRRWRRFSDWPFIPLTPTFPLAPIPLPSKWHTRFLPPLEVGGRSPEAADDAQAVRSISADVRQRLVETMGEMRRRRPSIFWGSVFEPAEEDR